MGFHNPNPTYMRIRLNKLQADGFMKRVVRHCDWETKFYDPYQSLEGLVGLVSYASKKIEKLREKRTSLIDEVK